MHTLYNGYYKPELQRVPQIRGRQISVELTTAAQCSPDGLGVSSGGKAVVPPLERRVAIHSHGLGRPDMEPRLALSRLWVLEVVWPAGEAPLLG